MLPSWCRDEITIERAPLVDKRGTLVRDWANKQEIEVSGCSVQERTTSREMDGRTLQITNGAVLYAPANANIQAGDRVVFNGHRYEIAGNPLDYPGATGRLSHKKIPLTEWSG